jgi:Escherichia/Staphylococcus phage prohead protease
MKNKQQLRFEIKEIAEDGSFEGLLSPYGNVDEGGDVVEPGAYTKTIQERGNKVPLLWQHKTDIPIGDLTLEDRADGLWCKGQLLMALEEAQKAYLLIKAGIVKGLSIGFDAIKESYVNSVRRLKEIKLYEGSIVTFPMNEQALITSVKSAVDNWPAESCRTLLAALLELKTDEPVKAIEKPEQAPITAHAGHGEHKAGRTISAATKTTISAAHEHMAECAGSMKSAMDLLYPLFSDEAEEGDDASKALLITPPPAAGTEKKSEPVDLHSAANLLEQISRALIPAA